MSIGTEQMVAEVLDLKQSAPLQGQVPKPFVRLAPGSEHNPAALRHRDQETRQLQRQLEAKYAPMHVNNIISKLGLPPVRALCILSLAQLPYPNSHRYRFHYLSSLFIHKSQNQLLDHFGESIALSTDKKSLMDSAY